MNQQLILKNSRPRRRNSGGAAAIEFVLISSFVIVPIILGLFSYGFALIRAMQAVQLTRDVAHMYAQGTDFSKQGMQDLLTQHLAQQLSLESNAGNVTGGTSGNGVVVLSTFQKLGAAQCPGCNNTGHVVVMSRIVIGNNKVFQTSYGTPNPALIDVTKGFVKNYTSDLTARADGVANFLTMKDGEIAYMAESYFTAPDLVIPGVFTGLASYSNATF
ncbi:MAG: pilus assembly protein [Acidobacteriia bacterium]|nr:pilus assembly protein [Terriglobia bacterium]